MLHTISYKSTYKENLDMHIEANTNANMNPFKSICWLATFNINILSS